MKILVIGPSWVGDMVMSQSLYKAIKANHPECELHVMAPRLVLRPAGADAGGGQGDHHAPRPR